MSGGHLVVLDRAGREVKQYDLPSGSAILGSDSSCDIRIMLPSVRPHHATVLVHANQSVIRNVGSGETLLNGVSVSVAALRQDDIVSLGGRELRWRYTNPAQHHARRRPDSPALQSGRGSRASRGTRGRKSEGARLHAPHASHRDSAPAAISTRQVAIVQPQRRDTADHIESLSNPAISIVSNVRRRTVKSDSEMETSLNKSIEVMNKSKSPKTSPFNLQNTTKATLWIESRKSSPRKSLQEIPTRVVITPKKTFSAKKSTPLRMAVLKKAQSAQKMRVTKIQAPLTIDHTKQAAIMLMTGHTPKAKSTPGRKASLVVTKKPRGRSSKGSVSASRRSMRGSSASDSTLKNGSKASLDLSPSVMEISDSDTAQSRTLESDVSQQLESLSRASMRSPTASPIKSALKDPRKSTRKTESIKFDLSNLDEPPSSPEDRDVRLRYSESPTPQPVNSRAREILRRTLGSDENIASNTSSAPVLAASPSSPRLARGSLMLQRALRTESTSPNKMESYSIVDLVSTDSTSSLYGSASDSSRYNSPTNSGRATRRNLIASTPAVTKMSRSRSAITSTTYDSIRDDSQLTYCSDISRRSKSLSTPAETQNGTYNVSKKKSQSPVNTENVNVTFNISRRSRQSFVTPDISKQNITDKKSLSTAENTASTLNASTKSRRTRSTLAGEDYIENITLNSTKSRSQSRSQMTNASMTLTRNTSKSESPKHDGTSTPKNQNSPDEAGTPVLSIQSLLDSDQNATLLRQSKKNGTTKVLKRKTIGGRPSVPTKRSSVKSKSLRLSTRTSTRSRGSNISNISPISSDPTEEVSQDDRDTTPKSAVKLVQEAVKNKHSTAKKPKSKRSIIDNLNDSDIVKQLFNSPVKRKLSHSMIEYSRKQNLDEDMVPVKRSTRKTIAFGDKTLDNSVLEQSQAITPERFVSPLSTPSNSPNVANVKGLFTKSTPKNDLRDVRGVKNLLQTPRPRRSVRNDLTQVSGVKSVFARSPKNRLSDVRIKEVFAASPNNDLRRVSGVKSLFRTEKKNKSPKNDLSDVANVRNLYKRNSPRNDLGNISGVKGVMRRNSPRNDLSDVRGVRKLFHLDKQHDDINDISGIEELFSESHQTSNVTDANSESSFNLLMGKPAVRSYGSKAKSFSLKTIQKPKNRKAKSLQNSFSSISNNVEDWLENELRKRMHKDYENATSTKKSPNKSNEQNIFDSTSNSKMSRSKRILELSMSERKGKKSTINNTNVTVERNKSKINVSYSFINKSKANNETFSKNVSSSKNETAKNNSDFTGDDGDISGENVTQFDSSNNSNKSRTNRTISRKNVSRSDNKTINNSDIIEGDDQRTKRDGTQFDASSTSVNKSKTPKELTLRKSMNRSRNKTAIDKSNIHVEVDQISKENKTQFDASSASVNKSKTPKELTLRKSTSRSRNKTAIDKSNIHVEDDQISKENETQFDASNNSVNKSNTRKELTPRKSMNRSKNKTAISNVEDVQISQGNKTEFETSKSFNKSKVQNEVTPRKSLNKSKNKPTTEANEISKDNAYDTSTNQRSTQSIETPRKSASKSKNKTNRSRELLKLATDTVDGNTPLLTTRVRNSTLIKNTSDGLETKKSTSEIYSAHTLPIKKRSLLDRDISGNINRDISGNKSEKSVLPIKKRAVVHSTPVKGRLNLTMNASEIGRVSPIAPVIEVTIDADANPITRNTEVSKISPRRRLLQARSSKMAPEAEANTEPKSPAPVRATRRKTKQSLDVNNVKKRKSSIVITKKTPVLSPKAPTNVSANVPLVTENAEPFKKTRGRKTRDQNTLQVDTEKEKPIPKKGRKATPEVQNQKVGNESPKAKLGRKTNIEKDKETSISQLPSEESVPKTRKLRGQKVATEKVSPPKKLTRTKASKDSAGRKEQIIPENKESEAETNVKPRRKAETNKVHAKEPETEKRSTRGARQKNVDENNETKSKKVLSKDAGKKDSSKTGDSGSSDNTSRGRKRKIADEESPPNVKKSKANDINTKKNQKTEQKPTESKQSTRGRQKNLESSENIETLKESRTRRRRVTETETTEANKKTSGKKEENNKIISESIEARYVRGKKKQPETAEIQSKANITESKRTRRGEGDAVKVNAETKPETEVKTTRRQKAKEPEKIEVTGKSRQQVNEPEETEGKGRNRQKVNKPETIEAKGRSRQKLNDPERTEGKGRTRQKINEPEETEAKGRSKQKVKEPEKTETKGKSRQKINEPEETKAKGRSRQKVNEPEKTETKGKSRQKASDEKKEGAKAKSQKAGSNSKQKVSEPEKADGKTTRRQKVIELEITPVTTRQQKATEPEKPLAGRKRKNDADSSTAKDAPPPSKTRKTQPVSPKAKRTRNAKVEEPQKPAARSRRR